MAHHRVVLPLLIAALPLWSPIGVESRQGGPGRGATATIRGRVTLEGTVAKAEPIRMSADLFCQRAHGEPVYPNSVVVSADGGLDNVFVYVKRGLEGRTFPPASGPAQLEQRGCTYNPHVMGLRTGQPLEIINSDPTLHNIHALPVKNPPFNLGQPIQGMRSTKTFQTPEITVPIKCDVHPWMSAYVGVVDHPFFAVTAAGGAYTLNGLPPGEYVIESWHERLGVQTQDVKVGPGEEAQVSFVFKARP